MGTKHHGPCHICGVDGPLSFEHVPPRAAYNDKPVLRVAFDSWLASQNPDELEGQHQQRGVGAYTLCGRCNSLTGHWYAPAFIRWAEQAMQILLITKKPPTLIHSFSLFPLRALKQVICMFFSVNGTWFQEHNSDLVRFVLNKESKEFPPQFRVYAFYTLSNRFRASQMGGVLHGLGSGNSSIHVFSEITFPPFGFVLTAETWPPRSDFFEISGFSQFDYRDWNCDVSMQLPLLPIYSALPGDYRTREQVVIDYIQSLREQSMRGAM